MATEPLSRSGTCPECGGSFRDLYRHRWAQHRVRHTIRDTTTDGAPVCRCDPPSRQVVPSICGPISDECQTCYRLIV